jgi:hypothetical protein
MDKMSNGCFAGHGGLHKVLMNNWLKIALEAERRLTDVGWGGKQALYETIATEHRQTPATIQRAVSAAKFVRKELPGCGLSLDQVDAALSSVETLRRIEKLSRSDATNHMRRALLGHMNYASLLSLAKHLERETRDAKGDGRSKAQLRRLVSSHIAHQDGHTGFIGEDTPSETATLLHADIELAYTKENCDNSIVILSPSWPISNNFGKQIEEALVALFASSLFYKRCYFVTSDMSERALFFHYMKLSRAPKGDIVLIFKEISEFENREHFTINESKTVG